MQCGAPALAEDARFCVGCGAPLRFSVPNPVESEGIRDPEPVGAQIDDDFVIRPKRELHLVPAVSERTMVIGAIVVIAVLLLVVLAVTW